MPIPPRPAPGKPPRLPQYVGDGDSRQDVAGLTDRAVAIKGLDLALRLKETGQKSATTEAALQVTIADLEKRLSEVENVSRDGAFQSRHEWDEMLVAAGHELSKRVKDPRDRLDSSRAREIAAEVVENAKIAADAKAFRGLKHGTQKVLWEVAKGLSYAGGGGAVIHWLVGMIGGHH